MKILDYQGLTLGHPAQDIWSIIYSATDAEYRAGDMEEDLRAYYGVLSGYMETKADYTEFRQELEERRVQGITMNGRSTVHTSSAVVHGIAGLLFLILYRHVLRDDTVPDTDAESREESEQVFGC